MKTIATWTGAWLFLILACNCSSSPQKKDDSKTQANTAANQPKEKKDGSSAQNIDWGAKIGSVGIESQSDKIGAASIDTMSLGGKDAAPKVAAFLEDPSPSVRRKAVEVLCKLGKDADLALPKLLQVLRNTDPALRPGAARVLAFVAAKASADGLKTALKDKNRTVAVWAHAGLSRIAGDCEDHLEEVAELLRDGSAETPGEAAEAIKLFNCPNEDAVKILIKAMEKDDAVRTAAAQALAHFGPQAANAVPVLMGCLKGAPWQVRQAALLALARIGAKAAPSVPLLIEILGDPSPRFRELSANALEGIGPPARSALPALKKASLDTEVLVQAAAKRALAAISKESASQAEPAQEEAP